MNLQIGQLISFLYQSPRSHDRSPEILVLHPGWIYYPNRQGNIPLVHGLNLNLLTNDEINLIRFLIDPSFEAMYFEAMERQNPGIANEYQRIIAGASKASIQSPHDFYLRVIKPFIQTRSWDPYRLYNPSKMQRIRILRTPAQMTGRGRTSTFGNKLSYTNQRTKKGQMGNNESQILQNLALKKSQEEKTGNKQLNPAENAFIKKLQGQAQKVFQDYKKKFDNAKGPQMNTRGLNFPGNQQPPWMKEPI